MPKVFCLTKFIGMILLSTLQKNMPNKNFKKKNIIYVLLYFLSLNICISCKLKLKNNTQYSGDILGPCIEIRIESLRPVNYFNLTLVNDVVHLNQEPISISDIGIEQGNNRQNLKLNDRQIQLFNKNNANDTLKILPMPSLPAKDSKKNITPPTLVVFKRIIKEENNVQFSELYYAPIPRNVLRKKLDGDPGIIEGLKDGLMTLSEIHSINYPLLDKTPQPKIFDFEGLRDVIENFVPKGSWKKVPINDFVNFDVIENPNGKNIAIFFQETITNNVRVFLLFPGETKITEIK